MRASVEATLTGRHRPAARVPHRHAHGLTPSAIATRLLDRIMAAAADPDAEALAIARECKANRSAVPGFGHHLHKPVDPRAYKLLGLARAEPDLAGRPVTINAQQYAPTASAPPRWPRCSLMAAWTRPAPPARGRCRWAAWARPGRWRMPAPSSLPTPPPTSPARNWWWTAGLPGPLAQGYPPRGLAFRGRGCGYCGPAGSSVGTAAPPQPATGPCTTPPPRPWPMPRTPAASAIP